MADVIAFSWRGCCCVQVEINGQLHRFDHAVQYFSAKDARFEAIVDEWLGQGAVREWACSRVGTLEAGGRFTPYLNGSQRLFVGRQVSFLGNLFLACLFRPPQFPMALGIYIWTILMSLYFVGLLCIGNILKCFNPLCCCSSVRLCAVSIPEIPSRSPHLPVLCC